LFRGPTPRLYSFVCIRENLPLLIHL
jgi:hypothetical protein